MTKLQYRFCAIFIMTLVSFQIMANVAFKNETLNYVITYKWGVLHKDAGDARLSLRNNGNNYSIVLTAKSKPWADKFYSVRDTLRATIHKSGFKPSKYVKIAHEKGKYSKDVITYSYKGGITTANVERVKIKDGKRKHLKTSFSSSMQAFDMLSVFYFLRTLDYKNMKKGTMIKKTIFSGSKKETITIRSLGIENVALRNKKKVNAFHIKFRFTSHNGKKSSDDMDTWISTDESHIPLLLVGSLPVGQVKCYYVG